MIHSKSKFNTSKRLPSTTSKLPSHFRVINNLFNYLPENESTINCCEKSNAVLLPTTRCESEQNDVYVLVAKTTHQTATTSTNNANSYNESQLLIANPTLHYSQSTCRNSQTENNKSKSIHGNTTNENKNLMKNYFYTFKSTKPTCSATSTTTTTSTTKSNLAFRKNKFISTNICNNLKKMSHENQCNERRQLYSAENYEEFVIIEPIEASGLNSSVLLSSKAIKSCESVDTSSNTSPVSSNIIYIYIYI